MTHFVKNNDKLQKGGVGGGEEDGEGVLHPLTHPLLSTPLNVGKD